LTRREFAAFAGASLFARPALAQTDSLLVRAIPSSGELVPAVGLGTARIFDNANEATRAKAAAVVQALVAELSIPRQPMAMQKSSWARKSRA
jgi:hypothetical protein